MWLQIQGWGEAYLPTVDQHAEEERKLTNIKWATGTRATGGDGGPVWGQEQQQHQYQDPCLFISPITLHIAHPQVNSVTINYSSCAEQAGRTDGVREVGPRI